MHIASSKRVKTLLDFTIKNTFFNEQGSANTRCMIFYNFCLNLFCMISNRAWKCAKWIRKCLSDDVQSKWRKWIQIDRVNIHSPISGNCLITIKQLFFDAQSIGFFSIGSVSVFRALNAKKKNACISLGRIRFVIINFTFLKQLIRLTAVTSSLKTMNTDIVRPFGLLFVAQNRNNSHLFIAIRCHNVP